MMINSTPVSEAIAAEIIPLLAEEAKKRQEETQFKSNGIRPGPIGPNGGKTREIEVNMATMEQTCQPQPEGPRPKGGFQKRIDKLTRQLYEVQAERNAWKAAAISREQIIRQLKTSC